MINYDSTYYVSTINTEARSYLYYIKIVYNKLSFVIVLLLSIVFIINYNKNSLLSEKLNNFIQTTSKPCIYTINAVNKNVETVFQALQDIIFLKKENTYLKQQNDSLKKKIIEIKNLKYENENLKNIINFVKINNVNDFVTIKYNAITKGKFANKIRLNIGKNNNIYDNNLVIDKNGNLIGKIVRSTENSSEIMLITDRDSKIEAITHSNRIKLILSGTNSNLLNILYIDNNDHKLIDGDLVFFINNNNTLDKELYIGNIVKIMDKFMVEVNKNFDYVDYLTIIKDNKINYNPHINYNEVKNLLKNSNYKIN